MRRTTDGMQGNARWLQGGDRKAEIPHAYPEVGRKKATLVTRAEFLREATMSGAIAIGNELSVISFLCEVSAGFLHTPVLDAFAPTVSLEPQDCISPFGQ